MKIVAYLSNLFHPTMMQDINVQEVLSGLNDASIRKHWLFSVLEEVKAINQRTHKALSDGKLSERFVQESARLQGIEFVLRQVLLSKNSVALDMRHNRIEEKFDVATLP